MEKIVANVISNQAQKYGEELINSPENKGGGKKQKGQQRKGRPALLQAKEERDKVLGEKLKFKPITDWTRKLEHMHTILTAENSTCKLKYFE